MERGLRDCCRSMRIGKMLIMSDEYMNEAKVFYAKFPPDIDKRNVLLMYPIMCMYWFYGRATCFYQILPLIMPLTNAMQCCWRHKVLVPFLFPCRSVCMFWNIVIMLSWEVLCCQHRCNPILIFLLLVRKSSWYFVDYHQEHISRIYFIFWL